MSVVFDHREPGTTEEAWLAVSPWAGARPLDMAVERLVVLAAHPDDETLGAGGLIAVADAAGVDVSVIVATDGEASHPGTADPAGMGARRRLEVVAALRELAPRARLRFLGLPDGGLRENADALRAALDFELGAMPFSVLLAAPWWGDGHRDHRIAGEAALAVQGPGVRVVGYPIWLWHWGDPDALDEEIPRDAWRKLALTQSVVAAKTTAIGRHTSQVAPLSDADGGEAIVHERMVAHFTRPLELFVDGAPSDTAASAAAHTFEEYFRTHEDPWGFETSWYEERKRQTLLAALPHRRYRHALELGCATGVLSGALAARADTVLGVDMSVTALERAHQRTGSGSAVRFERRTLPHEWPHGRFDLVVLSEVGYYWSPADLDLARRRIASSLTEHGTLVACHWRRAIPDAPLNGDEVHAALGSGRAWKRMLRHLESDFILEVFERTGGVRPADEEGQR